MMDRLPRFSICFSRSKASMIPTTTTTTQVRKLMRQDRFLQPQIGYSQVQQQDHDDSISFRCSNPKKVVSWASSTVDNESTPKKSFHKEYYFSQAFEVNRQTYLGITPGSMQMKLVKRI